MFKKCCESQLAFKHNMSNVVPFLQVLPNVAGHTTWNIDESNRGSLLEFIEKHLPEICFIGDNFSCDFVAAIKLVWDAVPVQEDAVPLSQVELAREKIRTTVFGTTKPTRDAILKLNRPKLDELSQYIISHDNIEPGTILPTLLPPLRAFCVKYNWMFDDIQKDIEEAADIAMDTFSRRLGELQRLLKVLSSTTASR